MIPTRLIRNKKVGSLISGGRHILPCRLYHSYVTVNSCLFRTVSDSSLSFSDFSLSVKSLVVKKSVKPFSSETSPKCWNCNKIVENSMFSCDNCGVLQHPNPKMTYFQLMNLPQNFDLNIEDISNKYKELQKIFHPDKFVHKSKEEIDISDNYSRLVNKAYSTLKDPLHRGLYILNLEGLQTDDDSVKMNQEFLMEVLEKNEEVENLKDGKALLEFQKQNSRIISKYVNEASKAFQKSDFQEAREVLMKMKYFVNIENEVKKKKTAMGIVD